MTSFNLKKNFGILIFLISLQVLLPLVGCGEAKIVRFRDPELSPQTPPPSEQELLGEPTFEKIKSRVFVRSCYSCHSVGGRAEDVPLDSIGDLLYSPQMIVVAGKSAESSLYLTLIGADEDMLMPPLKSSVPRVSPQEIEWIKRWIDEGAKE